MAQRIHILGPQSITPIGRYIEYRRAAPGDTDVQAAFACVLLYREREFRSFHGSSWRPDHLPAAGDHGPFAPYGLTEAAAGVIAKTIRGIWGLEAAAADLPEDLFGLKEEALAGLSASLRPIKAHAFATLVVSRLQRDLCQYEDAFERAMSALSLGVDAAMGFALAWDAVCLTIPAGGEAGRKRAESLERQARSALRGKGKSGHRWQASGLERFDEKVRQHALRTRLAVEGESFSRFLSTEAEFCERERIDALRGFDEAKVPADLRDLIPVAQRFGIGDDVCRGQVIRKTRAADRKAVASAVGSRAQRIQGWLDSLGEPPYGTEAACFFWFLEALEEMAG
ncbi:MAG TPA: hypothetical protein VFO58_19465 [Vicinamibacterales bacterium]|nr:hypothetical protein [Vicinamibacterales bacterium]